MARERSANQSLSLTPNADKTDPMERVSDVKISDNDGNSSNNNTNNHNDNNNNNNNSNNNNNNNNNNNDDNDNNNNNANINNNDYDNCIVNYLDIDNLKKSEKITSHKWDAELSRRKLLLFYYLIRGQTFNR